MKKYKLMIKTHNITGLKYLCITKKDNWEKYTGSGVRWKKHLQKHGNDISTELLYSSDDYNDFLMHCYFYSDMFEVSINEEFANLIPEYGYGNGTNKSNLELWWEYASQGLKQEMIKKRNDSISKNHWSKGENRNNIIDLLSNKSIKYWNTFSIEERRCMTEQMRNKSIEFFKNKNTKEYKRYVKEQSSKMKMIMDSTPFTVLSERNRKSRLGLSESKRLLRKQKIQKVYKTGKHDSLFEKYSEERKGIGNPYAKIIVWENKKYTKSQFNLFLKENSITYEHANQILSDPNILNCYRDYEPENKTYEVITCPHCNKQSKQNKKPSSFKRWHFDNCKEKK